MCRVGSGTDTTTELSGNDVICPGRSGIFECKTTNTGILIWRVNNNTNLVIPGDNRVNNPPITESGNVATLVELELANGNIGNRTSILRVPPTTNKVTIFCVGGDAVNNCSKDILFIGNATLHHVRG